MQDYIYSVARIRSKETELLGRQDIDMLLDAQNYADALRILTDKGYTNDGSVTEDELNALWHFLDEVDDGTVLRLLRTPFDYHNIKAAVKSVFSDFDGTDLLSDYGTVDKETVYSAVKNRAYGDLPESMAETAEKAMSVILQTGDSQQCDIDIDKAELNELLRLAQGEEFIKKYVLLKIKFFNLKTAFRCAVMEKSEGFIRNALFATDGGTDTAELAKAAENGTGSLIEYLLSSGESEAAENMKKSAADFEKWCDNKIMEHMTAARYEISGAAPIISYAYAKLAEINTVRLILSAKRNNLKNIRERVRELYV